MRKFTFAILLSGCVLAAHGQTVLTLDSCRALALRNNKQINVSRLGKEVAMNTRKAARTKYLPKVDVLAGYEFTSRDINLLSNKQKNLLNNMGTNLGTQVSGDLQKGISEKMTELVKQGAISMEQAQQIGAMMQQAGAPVGQYAAGLGNTIGQQIVDAFRTDTKNVFGGAVILRQPIFMGGAIKAANAIADIMEEMAGNDESLKTQGTIYDIDKAYWTVVSLKHKQKLAYSYRDLVKKLDDDVKKMIEPYKKLNDEGMFMPEGSDAFGMFAQGAAVFCSGGTWSLNTVKEMPFGWVEIPPIQIDPENAITNAVAHTFVLPTQEYTDAEKTAIGTFISWFEDNAMMWAQAGSLVANKAVSESEEFKALPQYTVSSKMKPAAPNYIYISIAEDTIHKYGWQAVYGQMSVDDYATAIISEIQSQTAAQ